MIRNMHGTISLARRNVGQVPPVQQHKPPARTAGLRSRLRARCVPDRAVNHGGAGDGNQPCALASETRSDPGDQEDARRSAHNPATARAVEMVGKRPAQGGLHPELLTRAVKHARSLGWLVLVVNGAALGGNLGVK